MLKNNNFVNKLKFNSTQNTITKNRKYIMNIYTQRQTVYEKKNKTWIQKRTTHLICFNNHGFQ